MLQPQDIIAASLVCKSWFHSTQHKKIVVKTIVKLKNVDDMNLFLNSDRSRKFNFQIIYDENTAGIFNDLVVAFNDNITEVLYNDRTGDSSFSAILLKFKILKNLEVLNINGHFHRYERLPSNLSFNFTKLILEFKGSAYTMMDIAVFYSIISIAPNLKELKVTVRNVDHQNEVFKNLRNSEIEKDLKVLKWLNPCTMDLNENEETAFYELKNLNLKEFIYQSGNRPNITKISEFLINQNNLKECYLYIPYRPHGEPFDYQAARICSIPNLKYLELDFYNTRIEDYQDLKYLWTLKSLRLCSSVLAQIVDFLTDLSEIESLYIFYIISHHNQVRFVLFSTRFFTDKFHFLTNLKIFNVTADMTAINLDYFLQAIIEHLINLQELTVTDWKRDRKRFGVSLI